MVMLIPLGNFKPANQAGQTSRIRSSQRQPNSSVDLTVKQPDELRDYKYAGTQQPSGSCALIYNPSTKTFVLEKLESDFTFNLRSTPSNNDRSEVTSQYPQLDNAASDVESEDGHDAGHLAPDSTEQSEPDPKNPYDYRHFLKRRRTSSPEPPVSRPGASPAAAPRRLSRTNLKPKPRPRPQQKPKNPPRKEPEARSEDSDDGDLTIDMGDSPKPRRFGNGAVVFNHDKRNGPISLRSAASSMSPASIRHDSGNEDAESDKDVEHLSLPSPASKPNVHSIEDEDADDEEADLVEEMMQAMESQEEEEQEEARSRAGGEQTIRRTIEESSSESEEE
ncbi:MAG: hypothetical protein Q9220_003128 [cf. Caloplaca sp. 1 TL-2023]